MGKLHKTKGDCPNWVNSDQMVLKTSQAGAWASWEASKGPKTKLAQEESWKQL